MSDSTVARLKLSAPSRLKLSAPSSIVPEVAWATRLLPLGGLAIMAALLPLRSNWGAGLVEIALAFTVPGVITLRAIRLPAATVRRFPIYVPAASLLVMMFAGLSCDLVAPRFGIYAPLHGVWTAAATLIASGVLWIIGLPAPTAARLRWAEALQRPVLLIPFLLPAFAALGALELSNGHGVVLARVSIFLDVAVFVGSVLLARRLTRGQLAAILFACALALEWSWSLRSQEIIGFDISTEIFIARHTQAVGLWHTLHRNDAYGAMLSIGVLPSVLKALAGISPLIAFKALYPALAALIPVGIFLIASRFLTRRFAAGAAALVLVQNYFFQQLPELARQEVALLFFAALVAVLLDRDLRRRPRVMLTVLLSIGVVVSHYSSTYLAIPLVGVAVVARLLVGRYRGVTAGSASWLAGAIALIGGAALWYGPITHSASNVSSFQQNISQHGLDLLPGSGNLLNVYLNGNNVQTVSAPQLERMAVLQYRRQAAYVHPLPQAAAPEYALRAAHPPQPRQRAPSISSALSLLTTVFNEGLLVMFTLGAIVMALRRRCSQDIAEVGLLGVGALAFLLFIRFSGTAASEYNETRALVQSLVVLALPAAWLAERLVAALPRLVARLVWPTVAVVLGVMLAQQSGAIAVAIGGGTSLNLSASGEDFERLYQTPAELSGARYAVSAAGQSILYADRYGQLRIFDASGRVVLTEVMPETLDRNGWIYGTRTNVVLDRARAQVEDSLGTYRWPSQFLDRFYNVVYDNGDSKVYHGG